MEPTDTWKSWHDPGCAVLLSALPPWFDGGTLDGKVFSDHHSLYCRYAFYGEGTKWRPSPPFGEGGGDCFFYALRRRLGVTEGVVALRERLIDQITATVVGEPNMFDTAGLHGRDAPVRPVGG
jgi:hypothetical protein